MVVDVPCNWLATSPGCTLPFAQESVVIGSSSLTTLMRIRDYRKWIDKRLIIKCTRVGIICVEEVDFFPSISIHITGRDPNSVPSNIPQSIIRWGTVIDSNVYQFILSMVVFQHQVRPIVSEGRMKIVSNPDTDTLPLFTSQPFSFKSLSLTQPPLLRGRHHHPRL